MSSPAVLFIDSTVAEIYDLEAQIAALQAQRKTLADALIEKGEGTYLEHAEPGARKVIVVVPSKWSNC